ncbi:hypothetical protein G6514_004008 [Epicoccum nigrum]|nr:hypothetical protein G6514_004008 [Epicoccum nigrum]
MNLQVDATVEVKYIPEVELSINVTTDTASLIDFDGPEDQANPLNWSKSYKWCMVVLISLLSLVVNLAILLCAPATPSILAEFKSTNKLDATLLVSIWELGEVLGPLVVAPLSET